MFWLFPFIQLFARWSKFSFQLSSQGDHGRLRRRRQVRSHPPVHVRRVRGGLRADKGRLVSKKGSATKMAGKPDCIKLILLRSR